VDCEHALDAAINHGVINRLHKGFKSVAFGILTIKLKSSPNPVVEEQLLSETCKLGLIVY